MNARRHLLHLFILTSFFLLLGAAFIPMSEPHKPADAVTDKVVVKQGVSIALQIDPVQSAVEDNGTPREGDDSRMKFTLLDAKTRQPLSGLHPAVWLSRRNPSEKTQSCQAEIKAFLQGGLSVQPEVNLNSYYILAMNDKASISVIDPHKGFGGTKLITRVLLHSPGTDWVLSKDKKKLFVATPLSKEVAVVDTVLWKTIAFISFDAVPKRLALQADGKKLWVGFDSAMGEGGVHGVGVIDPETDGLLGLIETGEGQHELAFSDDDRFAYIGNSVANTISVVDTENLTLVDTVRTAAAPTSLAYSAASESLLAALENGSLLVIDSADRHIISELKLARQLDQFRISGDGRWGIALSRADSKVVIVDVPARRLVHSLNMADEPDQVAFTETYAYIHSAKSETVSLIQLDAIDKGQTLAAMDFPAGQKAPGQTVSHAIVATPERMGVIVANPADKTLFYYMEGMAAPMGSFDNYGLAPESVMVLDRSIEESEPGVYVGSAKLPPAGEYSAAILLHHPQVYHCFEVSIDPSPESVTQVKAVPTVDYVLEDKKIIVGQSVPVKLKVARSADAGAKGSVEDLEVLIYRMPGIWQQRKLAKRMDDEEYLVEFSPPEAGLYQIFARSDSLGFGFEKGPSTNFYVAEK
ncbi:MAG: YncE family protein [Gammaproteobacteria bacterium]